MFFAECENHHVAHNGREEHHTEIGNLYALGGEWVDECSEKDQVESIAYGIPIPAMYQNDVYKKYLSQMEGAA